LQRNAFHNGFSVQPLKLLEYPGIFGMTEKYSGSPSMAMVGPIYLLL
jgi:hypothetical protein